MILLPHKRDEMFHYLQALADSDYQLRVWIRGEGSPETDQDCLGYALTFFFEDTMLIEAPERNVGTILTSTQEAASLQKLAAALIRLIDYLGDNRSDLEYISSPYWRPVIAAAQEALRVCTPHKAGV